MWIYIVSIENMYFNFKRKHLIVFFMLLIEKFKVFKFKISLLMHPEFLGIKGSNANKREIFYQGKLSETEERRVCP